MKMRMRQAIACAIADEMETDSSVIVFGEDIAAAGGAFKATEGLYERFGSVRVRDTPISETAFLGAAVGAAATGLRPVVEIMYVEFFGVALDQVTTQAASLRYLSRGELQVPMTIRASAGAGLGFGCQHSQMLEHWFRGTPGLKVVVPSDAQSAYGLLRSAIRCDDPVIFLEPKALYGSRGDVVTGEAGILHLGKARTVRAGGDVTLVTLGQTTGIALAAAEAVDGWEADVIDLLTIAPWDRDSVMKSVAKTGRLVVVEENPWTGGWSAEVCDAVTGELWSELKAPPLRITAPDVPIPYAGELEERFIPSPRYVREQVTHLIQNGTRPAPWWAERSA
jgi:pyruvate/2-oxoglutarate/acetoin dehydrogenase E1 component